MFKKQNVHFDIADKSKGLRCAGLGVFLLLVQQLGLTKAIDNKLHLLKRHVPYFESDHVLNLTYNLLVGGKTINDLEKLRNNETYSLFHMTLHPFIGPVRLIGVVVCRQDELCT